MDIKQTFNHAEIESKWQNFWNREGAFRVYNINIDRGGKNKHQKHQDKGGSERLSNDKNNDNVESDKKKYYVLSMFAYPSGNLHMGHLRNYSISDVIARRKRMQGYNVLHPFGWDAFGLPAENASIDAGVSPCGWTLSNIERMRNGIIKFGISTDWSSEIATCLPDYYGKQQALFIRMWEEGLIYRENSLVNWDPVDKTVLANEQVIDGRGWRSGALVEARMLKQWFAKTTDFSGKLLDDLHLLKEWPEKVRIMQSNWIGRSRGVEIDFALTRQISDGMHAIRVYTTRPEIIFGATFIAVSPIHPLVQSLLASDTMSEFEKKSLSEFVDQCNIETISNAGKLDKRGYKLNLFAKHPLLRDRIIPVYAANFVLNNYGTGAIFGCPGHDARDNEFAKQYPEIDIISVIEDLQDHDKSTSDSSSFAQDVNNGVMIKSNFLDGLMVDEAREVIMKYLEENDIGRVIERYTLRDWCISRQRYWGCPIPMIHCERCGVVPVKIDDLPVLLPDNVLISGNGNPLERDEEWRRTKCPQCGSAALRETDTMDTFFDSSWYFLRFCGFDPLDAIKSSTARSAKGRKDHRDDDAGGASSSVLSMHNSASIDAWMSVDKYVGGIEHAVLHLMYSRFFMKAMGRCGYFDENSAFAEFQFEPFKSLITQGMLRNAAYKNLRGDWINVENVDKISASENGDNSYKYIDKTTGEELRFIGVEKMSKSKKNGINPEDILEKYGADAARLFILSDSPPEKDLDWNPDGIDAVYRYLQKLYRITNELVSAQIDGSTISDGVLHIIHSTISKVNRAYDSDSLNVAIAEIRTMINCITNERTLAEKIALMQVSIILISPITPHIASEMWEIISDHEMLIDGYDKYKNLDLSSVPWPVADKLLAQNRTVSIAIQVNGKTRRVIEVESDISKERLIIIAQEQLPTIAELINSGVKKYIFVPNKILNLIV